MKRLFSPLGMVLAASVLVACERGMSDLEQRVAEVKSKKST